MGGIRIGGGGGGRRRTSVSTTFRSSVVSAPVIESQIPYCLSESYLHQTVPGLGLSSTGKVRDIYEAGHHVILVSTDRLSAFDRVLAAVPFKGQVLNQTSLWWFDKTKHIVPNAVVAAPDPNVTIATRCNVFPVEFVGAFLSVYLLSRGTIFFNVLWIMNVCDALYLP